MWSYYGSKSKVVNHYPRPIYNKIIEPFAGSARYSLKYFDKDVLLVDKYEVVVRLWKWLQVCSPNDILKLPKLKAGDKIRREDFDCIEQAWLMGYLITNGVTTPMLTCSPWGQVVMEKQKKDIAAQLFKIKHWEIRQGDYSEIENQEATWFIDSPYKHGGDKYRFSNKKINYEYLASWSKERWGQSIVCENMKADWMDFKPVAQMNGIRYRTTEAMWTNINKNEQIQLF